MQNLKNDIEKIVCVNTLQIFIFMYMFGFYVLIFRGEDWCYGVICDAKN